MTIHRFILSVLLLPALFSTVAGAQDKSLKRYSEYAYAGEWDTRNPDKQALRIIKDGKVDFEYTLPNGAVGQILDIFDYVSNNVLMPFLSICTCLLIGWVVTPKLLVGEMRLNGYSFHRKTMYVIMLKYVVPFIMAILLLGAFGLY